MPRTSTIRTLLLSMSVLTMAACSSEPAGPAMAKTSAPMPPIEEMDMAMNTPPPLAESDTLTPVMPQATPVNTGTMTVEQRIAKLEDSVSSLKSEYSRMAPAITSMSTTNDRIQTLLDELEKETGKLPPSAPVPPPPAVGVLKSLSTPPIMPPDAPPSAVAAVSRTSQQISSPASVPMPPKVVAPVATPEPVATTAVPAADAANTVKGLRIGEHGSKTRLVFDLTSTTKPGFKYDLDNNEKLLVVDMAGASWAGAPAGKPASPMIESWSVQKSATGSNMLAVQLKKNARVISTEFLKPEGKDPARLVLDLAPGV